MTLAIIGVCAVPIAIIGIMNIVLKQLTVVVATSLVVIIVSKLVTTSKGDVLSSNTASSDQASLTPTITAPPSPVPTAVPSPTVEPIPEPTVEPTLKPSLEPTPTPTITPTSTITPTPTQAPDIYALTESYAHEYSIDPNLLRHIAQCESGFNPSASHLDYAGLYQFSSSAWRKYRLQQSLDPNPELRLIAEEAIHTAAYVLSIGHSQIWPSCMP